MALTCSSAKELFKVLMIFSGDLNTLQKDVVTIILKKNLIMSYQVYCWPLPTLTG